MHDENMVMGESNEQAEMEANDVNLSFQPNQDNDLEEEKEESGLFTTPCEPTHAGVGSSPDDIGSGSLLVKEALLASEAIEKEEKVQSSVLQVSNEISFEQV